MTKTLPRTVVGGGGVSLSRSPRGPDGRPPAGEQRRAPFHDRIPMEALASGSGRRRRGWLTGVLIGVAVVGMKVYPDPRNSWMQLSWSQRREILRYARGGRRHPDERLAGIANAWAVDRLARRDASEHLRVGLVPAVLGLLGEGVVGGYLGMAVAERRAARRILRATEAGHNSKCGDSP